MSRAPDDADVSGPSHRGSLVDALWGLGAALLALLAGAWSLRIWDWRRGTPFQLDGDGPFLSMQLRDLSDHGWYWHNPDLAYPFGQVASFFPELNVLHVGIVKLLGLAAADPYTPGVVYFVLGFPLAAATMFALARSQGLSRWAALVAGVLFANAPGHQERFHHLWLAAYWVVPLGMWVVLEVLRGRGFFNRDPAATGVRSRVPLRGVLAVTAMVVIGLSGIYYVAFTLLLLAAAMLARRWQTGNLRSVLPAVVPGLVATAVFALPLLVARWSTRDVVPTGPLPAQRSFAEADFYAGKMMDLVLPWAGHRFEPLAFLSFAYNTSSRATVEASALGVIGAFGWVALVVVALTSVLGVRRPEGLRQWSFLTLVATALYTVGGLGAWVALFITPQARTWSRMSLYLLLLSLLLVGWWLTRLERRRGAVVAGTVAVGLVLLGVLDQTNPARAPEHAANAVRFERARQYTTALENRLGRGCPVFQLPVVPFPESSGTGGMGPYEQLIPYLASGDLRFSTGAMRGTAAADWQLGVDMEHPVELADQLAEAGFCALEVDTHGFDSSTDPRVALEDALGAPVAQSDDGVFVAYRLPTSSTRQLGTSAPVLHPVIVALDAYDIHRDRESMAQWVGPEVGLRVLNLGEAAVPLSLTMTAQAVDSASRELTVTDAAGKVVARERLSATSPTPLTLTVTAPPGSTPYRVRVSGDPVRQADTGRLVSALVRDLKATTTATDTRVVTLQDQVRSGAVIP